MNGSVRSLRGAGIKDAFLLPPPSCGLQKRPLSGAVKELTFQTHCWILWSHMRKSTKAAWNRQAFQALSIILGTAALAAGAAGFFFGRGVKELASAPRYRPMLPIAGDAKRPLLETPGTRPGFPPTRPVSAGLAGTRLPTARDVIVTKETGNWIRIPTLTLALPLATTATMDDQDVLPALQSGVVRYPNGVEPGQPGVVVIAGHSTGEPWKGPYRFAFLNARKLRPGDVIHLDHERTRYTYRVNGQRMVNPRVMPYLDTAAASPRLALVTCWPLWTTDQRLIVDAELVRTAQLVTRPTLDAQKPGTVALSVR